MKILRSYLLRELGQRFLMSLLVITSVLLVGNLTIRLADLVINKGVSIGSVTKIIILSVPFLLIFTIPMAVLISTLLTFGRLSHDNEITAMKANGIGVLKIFAPLALVVFIISLCNFVIANKVAPQMHFAYRQVLSDIGLKSPAAILEEGVFIKHFKGLILFIYEIKGNQLRGIRIYQPQENRPTRTIVAQRGELISIPERKLVKLKLINGISDEPDPNNPSQFYKLDFKIYYLPLDLSQFQRSENLDKKPKDMTIRELRQEIERFKQAKIPYAYLLAEIHNKAAIAFSSLAFFLIAFPLALKTSRGEKSVGFGLSLLLITLYWTLLIGGKVMAERGIVPALVGLHMSNILMMTLGILLFIKTQKA